MTNEQLAQIHTRLEAATPGPWHAETYRDSYVVAPIHGIHSPGQCVANAGPRVADAEFIAAARTDVETLLTEVERLRGRLAAVGGFGEHD